MSAEVARVRSVTLLGGFLVRLGFTDGTQCTVDLELLFHSGEREALRDDRTRFEALRVDEQRGELVWPGLAGLSPEALWNEVPAAFLSQVPGRPVAGERDVVARPCTTRGRW